MIRFGISGAFPSLAVLMYPLTNVWYPGSLSPMAT